MGPFGLDLELNPLEEGSAELSDHTIVALTGKLIHKFFQVIQGFMFELVHMRRNMITDFVFFRELRLRLLWGQKLEWPCDLEGGSQHCWRRRVVQDKARCAIKYGLHLGGLLP